MSIILLITDRYLQPVGDPITQFSRLQVTLRFNEPSSGVVSLAATPQILTQLDPRIGDPDAVDVARRLVVIRAGQVFCAGPIEQPATPERWQISHRGQTRTITAQFADDLALVAGRLAYPNPAQAATEQTVSHWVSSGQAETLIRDLVDSNAGPGALPARRIPQLVLGDVAGVGTNITVSARFAELGLLLRQIGVAGGGLGFRTQQVGSEIVFEVYQPRNLAGQILYSTGLGNLREYSRRSAAPTVTAAIVAGQGEGAARTIRERVNTTAEAAWWRIERWVDRRQTDDVDELDQAGDEVLIDGAETAEVATVTVDTPDQRFGVDYGLGDVVAVETIADVVRAVVLEADGTGREVITSVVGSQQATADPMWLRLARQLAARIASLETS